MPKSPKLIVHIGAHKTGSTSVQVALEESAAALAEQGVWIPPSTHHPVNHSFLATLMFRNDIAGVERWFALQAAEAKRAGASVVLVSGEDLCRISASQARALSGIVWSHFGDVVPVLYLRDKDSYYYAQYRHWLTHGEAQSLSRFVKTAVFSPRKVARIWRGVGNGNCGVHLTREVPDVAAHFLNTYCGVEVAQEFRANESLSGLMSILINAYAKPETGSALDEFVYGLMTQPTSRVWTNLDVCLMRDVSGLFPSRGWIVELDDGSEVAALGHEHTSRDPGPEGGAGLAEEATNGFFEALSRYTERGQSGLLRTIDERRNSHEVHGVRGVPSE